MGWAYNTPDDAANDGSHITAVAIVFTTVSFLVLSLRVYVRGCMIKATGAGTYFGIRHAFRHIANDYRQTTGY
jgi:hypothetical protein